MPDAVVLLAEGLTPPWHRGWSTPRTLLRWPFVALRALPRRIALLRRRGSYRPLAKRVLLGGTINSRDTRRVLAELEPDVIVLGGGGIVQPETLARARSAVLNAHPALLPWVRGNGVVAHSLEQGIALGATVHRVDPGIDTGAILRRRLLPAAETEQSLTALQLACDALAAETMADVVEEVLATGTVPPGCLQVERHPLYRLPPPRDWPRLRALAESGAAATLFAAWAPYASPGPGYVLPEDLVRID